MTTMLSLNIIRTDGGTQPRATLDWSVVTEYAEDMASGVVFPPIVAFYDGSEYWLADGFHRTEAAERAGLTEIAADIRQGTVEDARWHSFSVNQSHGLRRTNEDKRRAVEAALQHSYASRYSSREIARHCGVSHQTVENYRDRICQTLTDTSPERIVTRNGATYTMNIAAIGTPLRAPVVIEDEQPADWWYGDDDDEPTTPLPFTPTTDDPQCAHPEEETPEETPQLTEYDGDEWYTPVAYINAARSVLGSIDLDPASCEEAQTTVQAATYFDKVRDGLNQEWHGRTWMNPPYSFPKVEMFTSKAIKEYESGRMEAAIILVNNCTDATWFHRLLERYPVCFTRGRVRFERSDRDVFSTRQGQAFFYLGDKVDLFTDVFSQFGVVLRRVAIESIG